MKNKKKKRIIISIGILFVLILLLNSSLARYIYNNINNSILESQGFYFNSSILKLNGANYSIDNWDGVNDYSLNIDVNNKKNDIVTTKSDIAYDIFVTCSDNVTCSLSKNKGIIYKNSFNDSYTIQVKPKTAIKEKEKVTVKTEVKSTSPYEKTMEATYLLGVEKANFSYEIIDEVGSKYLALKITNSVSFYKVITAFGNYQVGDTISLEVYQSLSDSEKAKCYSAKVKLTFPSDEIYLDMTDPTYINRINNSQVITTYDNYDYVSGYQFYVPASSDTEIRFYKKSIRNDYTYPVINQQAIIQVQAETASNN